MYATAITHVSRLLAAAPDGRWMGYDYVLALFAGTFPAWTLFTLVRGWLRERRGVRATVTAPAGPARRQ